MFLKVKEFESFKLWKKLLVKFFLEKFKSWKEGEWRGVISWEKKEKLVCFRQRNHVILLHWSYNGGHVFLNGIDIFLLSKSEEGEFEYFLLHPLWRKQVFRKLLLQSISQSFNCSQTHPVFFHLLDDFSWLDLDLIINMHQQVLLLFYLFLSHGLCRFYFFLLKNFEDRLFDFFN